MTYANQIQTRATPRPPTWGQWITSTRLAGPPSEGDAALTERHLGEDVFPQMGSEDEFLRTRWFSGGLVVEVETARGVPNDFDPNVDEGETQAEHDARHEAEVLAKVEQFPIDTE